MRTCPSNSCLRPSGSVAAEQVAPEGEVGKGPEIREENYLGIGMDEPHLDGVAHQPRHAMNAEALHELGAVRLDGLQRHLEAAGDLLVGMPLGDELQHLALAWREYLEWPAPFA